MRIKYLIYRLKYNLNFLTHLDIEINNSCNHKCVFCWHSKEAAPLNFKLQLMPFEKIESILVDGRRSGMMSVKLNLRGEPTLHPRIVDIARRARELGYVDVMINSNGELLSKKWMDLRKYVTTVIVSIGSTNVEKYARLHDVTNDQAMKVQTSLSFVHANKGNVDVRLNCHASVGGDIDFDYLKKRFPRFKIVKRHLMKRKGKDLSIERKKVRKKKCPHMMRRLTVQANGNMYPCCLSYDSPKDIRLGSSMGESLDSRKKLIAAYKKGEYRQSCIDCTSQDVFKYEKRRSKSIG